MTNAKIWVPAIGILLACACTPRATVPNGAQVIDEDVTLTRLAGKPDTARRELRVHDDVILVAIVEENLTDVKLGIVAFGPDEDLPTPVEVENNLTGTGIEVAALAVADGTRVRFTLTGPRDALEPGKVHLRVRQYAANAARDARFSTQLDAFRAWTSATNAALRANDAKKTGVPDMQRAIDGLDAPHGDAALAAHARLAKARMLQYFRIDWRESRAEAQRAAGTFAKLPDPDAVQEARARYLEALALIEISKDRAARSPTADEAMQIAKETLVQLSAPKSILAPIERARASSALGQMAVNQMLADDANRYFEQARATFEAAGHTAGVREMRCNLGMVLVEQGRFPEAARLLDPMLSEFDQIADPELRVKAYLSLARAQSFSGRTDEGAELLLKALPIAKEYQLRQLEGSALLGLGYLYQNRGDLLQAHVFAEEALKIAREDNDVAEYVTALASAGAAARANGDLDRAFKLHREAIRLAPTPVAEVRTRLDLGIDYYRLRDFPAAIAAYREALAVDLHDPMHHVFTDGKIGLAQFFAEYDRSTARDLEEADKLLTESMQTSVKVGDQFRVIFTTRVRGQVDARRGRDAAALAGFEQVLAMGQEFRARSASSEARSTFSLDEQMAFRGFLDIVLAGVANRGPGNFQPASPRELAGMQRLERARYESFGALRVGQLDAPTAARVDGLLAQMAQKSLRIATLVRSDTAAHAQELQDLQSDMARLHAELDHARTSAAAKQAYSSAASAQKGGWRAPAPGTAQLSYLLAQKHVYALVRSASGTRVAVLAPSRKELEEQLAALARLDVQTSSREIEAELERVSAVLLPAGLLPASSTALEIVAEGRIGSVPFSALRSPTNPGRRLIETHDVAMVTSLFDTDVAPRVGQGRPYRFVALASGSGTYRAAALVDPTPRLHAATREIRTAADLFIARDPAAKIKLFMGADGTAAALRDIWASGADVVHFATHALADLRQPTASLLVLPATDASGKSTYLTAGQVEGWRGDAELVFLSACESAVGPPQYAAGMPGLQRAFLRAGARGVIATLWPIEDVLAQEFSEDFYHRFTGGTSAALALRETQRAWLVEKPGANEAEMTRRRMTAVAHGFYMQ